MHFPPNSHHLVILSEVTNGNEAEGPAVAFRMKLKCGPQQGEAGSSDPSITLLQPNLPKMMQKMRQIILSQKS